MAKEVAHPKNTGGGGYGFEDKVVAYLFACLLTDQPPLDARFGTVERVDFQVHVDGWHLDDVLVTLRSSRGRHCMPTSLKSNQQFSKDAAPADFVESAWETFLDRAKTKFDPALDLLGFVTLPPDAKLLHQFHELMAWARAQDTADLARRVKEPGYGNDLKRSLLTSFACPASVAAQFSPGLHLTADLLQCIQHLAYDFEQDPSSDLSRALAVCRTAVTSGELDDARLPSNLPLRFFCLHLSARTESLCFVAQSWSAKHKLRVEVHEIAAGASEVMADEPPAAAN